MTSLSGRFVLRLPPELHRRLRDRAREAGASLNALCAGLLDAGLSIEPVSHVAPGLEPGLLDAVAGEWREDLVGVAFFGSAARGEATEESDLDILLVLDEAASIERSLYDRWDRLVRRRGRPADARVSPQFVALPPSPGDAGGIWLEVAREGIVLLDRDGRLSRFLIALRDFISSGSVHRKTVHGHPYWVREGRKP